MPRKKLIRTDEYPYHVVSRSNNREWFRLPLDEVWDIFTDTLECTVKKYHISPHCFTLMNNHFHMLVSTPKANIDRAMKYLIHQMSLKIGASTNRINKIFGGRYRWSLITEGRYFRAIYRYIYQNPIKVDICDSVVNYPYNSLNYTTLRKLTLYEIKKGHEKYFSNRPFGEVIEWLSGSSSGEDINIIRLGLRRSKFEISVNPNTKRYRRLGKEWMTL